MAFENAKNLLNALVTTLNFVFAKLFKNKNNNNND